MRFILLHSLRCRRRRRDGPTALGLTIAAALSAAIGIAGCSKKDGPSATTTAAVTGCGSQGDDDDSATADAPDDLACTGLYTDMASKTLAANVRPYAPAVPLWSDGAEKHRYIQLPDGAKIDAKNMDDWTFPVGTKVWKEFAHGDRKIETRLFWKQTDTKWVHAAYVWTDDGSSATRGEGKALTIDGKPYQVPKNADCDSCHLGRKDKLLGFEAVSLAQPGATGVTLEVLAASSRIDPAPSRTNISLPEPGLGVLHVNCGVCCHNNNPTARAQSTGLHLRLSFDDVVNKPVEQWDSFTTAVGIEATGPGNAGLVRVTPSVAETSLIVQRMSIRGNGQMPPLATTIVDDAGVAAVSEWIRSLPAPVVTGVVAPPK